MTVHEQSVGEPGAALPRSVLVANVLSSCNPTLFVAMADGSVITFSLDSQKQILGNMNRIILGSEPVFFKPLSRDTDSGLSNVFASCEQPSLIYASEGRIIYSAVHSDKASRVCQFNSEAYPGAIAIATPTELKLAVIDTERTTQLETLSVGETVRCVTYSPRQKVFGIGCIRRILESGAEGLLSSVKIADEITFKELDSYELKDGELIECIISTGAFEADDEDASPFNDMFVVGTSLLELSGTGDDTAKGRIIVFEITKDRELRRVAELGVKGACRSLAMCEGKVVAGLVKTVSADCITKPTKYSLGLAIADISHPLGCPICPHSVHHTWPPYNQPLQIGHLPHLHKSSLVVSVSFNFYQSCHYRRSRSHEIGLHSHSQSSIFNHLCR